MSYGHADKIAAIVAGSTPAGSEKPTPPIDPTLYHRDDMRAVLAAHDIASLYQLLKYAGLTQRDIARLTGQSQSEVSEILTDLGEPDKADTALGKARELWQPTRAASGGELDRPAARLALDRGHLERAEQFASASVRRWEGAGQRGRTHSDVVLATVHVRAGEPRGLQLAHSAIVGAGKLTSARVRRRLEPLAAALETQRGSDAEQLARMARQVATTRA